MTKEQREELINAEQWCFNTRSKLLWLQRNRTSIKPGDLSSATADLQCAMDRIYKLLHADWKNL